MALWGIAERAPDLAGIDILLADDDPLASSGLVQ
jgi:hypothetical protein